MNGITVSMINNAALLLVLSIVYELSFMFRFRQIKIKLVINGILIGLIGLAIMLMPFELVPGLVFDTRSILISVAALAFGIVPASIAAGMTIIYRMILGGVGVTPGVSVIIVSLIIGLMWRKYIPVTVSKLLWLKAYIFGITVHAGMLLCMFTLPPDLAIQTITSISLPVMLIYPIGTVVLCMLLMHQISRNEALIQAAEAESRYKTLFYNSHAVMLLIDPADGRILDANPAAVSFYGWPETVIKTMNITQINALSPEFMLSGMKKAIQSDISHFISKHVRASGNPVDVDIYTGPMELGGRKILYSIVHDITDSTATLNALQESEERFRTLVNNAPDAIFLLTGGKFVFVNPAGLSLLGARSENDLLGKSGMSIIHPDFHKSVTEYMANLWSGKATFSPMERVYLKVDGSPIYVDVSVVPIRYNNQSGDLVYARDITERKLHEQKEQALEAQLRQQQKLEAIGTLAGGVAHEINNPLNGVMNYAQLIMDASESGSTNAIYSREIVHETERISLIVKNLLQFSRQEKQSHSYASFYDIVERTVSLINTIIKKDQIKLDIQLDDNLPDIKCRSQQIQQVIMNLLTNARDSLNEKYPEYNDNKVIRMRCGEYVSEGRRWLKLTVTDYGVGIQQELRDRIYEPFFSTKPKENGTGLGLSISYGIVSEHHGKMTFDSVVGKYTTFIIDLPVDNGWSL